MTSQSSNQKKEELVEINDESQNPTAEAFSALDAIRDEPQLRQAFEQFSQHSMRLEEAYNTLEAQFRQVSAQLHEVYCQLDVKIGDLASAEQYLERLLSQMSQGVFFTTRSGEILTCNQAMSKWLNIKSDEVIHTQFDQKFPDDYFGFSMKTALQESRGPELCYTQPETHDGLPLLEISTNFITYFSDSDDQKRVPQEGLCIMARDITELRRLQTLKDDDDKNSNRQDETASLIQMMTPLFEEIKTATLEIDDQQKNLKDQIGEKIEALIEVVKTNHQPS